MTTGTRTVHRSEHVRRNPRTGEPIPVRRSTATVEARPKPPAPTFARFDSTGTAADPFAPAEPADKPDAEWDDEARQWAARAMHCRTALREGHGPAWRNETNGRLFAARARICADKGTAPFPGLFASDGTRANARLRTTRFGRAWMVFADDDPTQVGEPVAVVESGSAELAKAGFAEREEPVRAWARMIVPVSEDGTPQPQRAAVQVFRMDKGRPSMN